MDFEDENELLDFAKELEGLRISEISELVGKLDDEDRKHTKGVVARIIETGYFGIPPNSSERPDFEYLGIELKVSPLKYLNKLNLYTTKERNVIKMVDYQEIVDHSDWNNTKLQMKLGRVLFVLYVHDNTISAWDWRVVKVFLWSPSPHQNELIQLDYNIIRNNVLNGVILREGDHQFLATCPKHGGGYLRETPLVSPSSSLANHPILGKAEKRGYCIKREAFIDLIAESVGTPLVQKGRSVGITSDKLVVK